MRVAAKRRDVVAYPMQRGNLVQETGVAGRRVLGVPVAQVEAPPFGQTIVE
jgi:hypothetical protein